MHAVSPTHAKGVPVLLRPCHDRVERALDPRENLGPRLLHRKRQCRVEHIGRGQPEVEPTAVGSERRRDRVDERSDVVVRLALELGDALGGRRERADANSLHHLPGNDVDARPPLEGRELDLQHPSESRLVRPDPRHLRS